MSMSATNIIIEKIIEIGPIFIIPVLLFLMGLITTRNILKNFLNCLYIFIGMLGLAITLTLFINFFKPLIEVVVSFSDKGTVTADEGWLVAKQVILNSPITLYILIAVFSLNILMLLLRLTRTINIDLWNWWIYLLAGSLIFSITENKWLGVLIAVVIYGITLVLGDIYAPSLESYYGLKGITNPQTQTVVWAPLTHLINLIFNKIPLVNRLRISFPRLKYKLRIFSEPVIIGFVLGTAVGLVIKYKTISTNTLSDILFSLGYGLYLSAVFVVLPRMSTLIFKGLVPAIDNIIQFINRKITKRNIHIGLDGLLFIGHPSVITVSIILIPFTAYIASILPGNSILPSADLIVIPLLLVWILSQSGGEIIRTFLSAAAIIPLTLWISTDMISLFTGFFSKYNIEIIEQAKNISSYGAGSNWLFWIILQIIKPLLNLFV